MNYIYREPKQQNRPIRMRYTRIRGLGQLMYPQRVLINLKVKKIQFSETRIEKSINSTTGDELHIIVNQSVFLMK
jgi:hypothetical protein